MHKAPQKLKKETANESDSEEELSVIYIPYQPNTQQSFSFHALIEGMSQQIKNDTIPAEPSTSEEHSSALSEQPHDDSNAHPPATTQTAEPTLGAPTKRRRTSKVDTVLAQAKDIALAGIQEITSAENIGIVHHLRGEEERLTTHLFECTMSGYRGWFWFATLSRTPRSKIATVCEVGLIPGDDALLAPAWVPWSERMNTIEEENAETTDTEETTSHSEDTSDDE